MNVKTILRFEGIALFAVATTAYAASAAPLWLFLTLALAPDIAMLGYLAGPRVGSTLYNAAHTYLAPVLLGAAGVWLGVAPLWWAALVWVAHIGVDRAVGYGLKYPTGLKDTHLSRLGGNRTQTTGLTGTPEIADSIEN
jgi:hypothetical protein